MKKSRRHFLAAGTGGLLAGAPWLASPAGFRNAYADRFQPSSRLGRVVVIRDPGYARGQVEPGRLLNTGMSQLLQSEPAADSWKLLFHPEDVVAIKVNALAGRMMSPRWKLVQAVIDGVRRAGVPADRIIVWDRQSSELQRAGYPVTTGGPGVRVFGTDALDQGYESQLSSAMSVGSCFSRILSGFATAAINIGVMKDHDLAGLSGLMKNFYGVIHNPNKYHDGNCSPYVAHLCTHPHIRGKTRLHILDAPLAQYHGGPAYRAACTWPFSGLLLTMDPVAGDRIALEFIENQRQSSGCRPLREEKRFPAYIEEAGKLGLGEHRRDSIQVMEAKP